MISETHPFKRLFLFPVVTPLVLRLSAVVSLKYP
jgi:hypothetical protein